MEDAVQQQTGEKLIRILAFTLVISVMSATMFNIVLPEIAADFNLSLSQVSWVSSAFLLIYSMQLGGAGNTVQKEDHLKQTNMD